LSHVDKSESNNEILNQLKNDAFKSNLVKKIEQDHTLSQFLIRNRKKNVFSEEFINERVVKTILVNPTERELELYNEIRLYLAKIYNTSTNKENIGIGFIITTLQKLLTSSKYAFLKSLERRIEQIERQKSFSIEMNILREEDPEYYELELEDEYIDSELTFNGEIETANRVEEVSINFSNHEKILRDFYTKLNALPYDSKSQKLVELVEQIYRQNSNEKLLVFTQFVDTLLYLKELLSSQNEEYFVEIFYGGLDKTEKDEAVERFRTSEKFAILISTEIGGEGRNFQFARFLINYDLPWNPMKLEQRIGRLDRIGQKSKHIYIYNFFLEGTIETDIIFALDKRIHLFEESIGQLEPIIGKIEKDIKNIIFTEDEGKRRKRLNEFNRKVDIEVKKAKEIEMQLDDLLIDKKSFKIDDLITSVNTCQEVKLSHNELFLLVKYFFDLYHGKYGIVENLKDKDSEASEIVRTKTKITINDTLLKNPKYKLVKEYVGTFDLSIAREREDIDFFALGHPLINDVIDFSRSRALEGIFTVLNLKRSVLPNHLISHFSTRKEFYLFIFNVKYQGYILENQFSAVTVDIDGNEIPNLADFVLDINNFQDLIVIDNKNSNESPLDLKFLDQLTQKAKNLVKRKTSQWKNEIKALNAKIFNIETKKKEKIFNHNKRLLAFKLESLKLKLEKKESKKPTERQLLNIKSINDAQERQERLDKINNLKEELHFLEKDIVKVEKKLDDLAFDYDDLKREMVNRNRAKYYTNLSACAILCVKE
jgi:superfamily II DNA/RNA helicase